MNLLIIIIIKEALFPCTAPFFVLGAFQILLSLICFILIPKPNPESQSITLQLNRQSISEKDPGLTFFNYITRPYVQCASIPLVMQSMGFGFFDVSVGPYLEDNFDIGGGISGYYFLPFAFMYALALVTLGPLVEKGFAGRIYLISIFTSALSFLLLYAPAVFPVLETRFWLMIWLGVQGLTISGSFVPASLIFEMLAYDIGFKDQQNVKLVAASWLNACFAIGRKFGPLVTGGFFLDLYGFYNSCLLQFGVVLITFLCALFVSCKKNLLILRKYSIKNHPEYELESHRMLDSESVQNRLWAGAPANSQMTGTIGG